MSTDTNDFCAEPTVSDNFFEKIILWVMYGTGSFCVLMVSLAAILRYFFHKDLYGSEELITLGAFWMYFAGAMYAAKVRGHISAEMVELFVKSQKGVYAIMLLRDVITFGLTLVFAWWALEFFWWSYTERGLTNLWQIPMCVGHSSVAVGFVVMSIYFLRDVIVSGRRFFNEG